MKYKNIAPAALTLLLVGFLAIKYPPTTPTPVDLQQYCEEDQRAKAIYDLAGELYKVKCR